MCIIKQSNVICEFVVRFPYKIIFLSLKSNCRNLVFFFSSASFCEKNYLSVNLPADLLRKWRNLAKDTYFEFQLKECIEYLYDIFSKRKFCF